MKKLAWIVFLTLPFTALAQKSILFTRETVININPYTYYLLDSSGNMTIEKVRKSSSLFTLTNDTDGLRLGIGDMVAWLKLRIHNPYDRKEDCVIDFIDPSLYSLTLYQKNGDPLYSGIGTPQAKKNIRGNSNSFILSLYPGETREVIIRVASENFMTLSASLTDDENFFQKNGVEKTFTGFFYGIIFFVCGYAVFLFLMTRLQFFIYYAIYLITVALFTGTSDGFTALYLYSLVDLTHGYYDFILGGLSNVISLLFMKSFFNLSQWSKKLHRLVIITIYGILLILTILLLINPVMGFAVMLPIGIYVLALILGTSILATMRNIPQAGFFLTAYIFNGIFIMLFMLNLFRLIHYQFIVQYSIHIGFILSVIILSCALGVRVYRIYRRYIQEQQIKQQDVEQRNLQLAEQVKNRTAEISTKENELRAILENSESNIWLVNTKFELLEANESYMNGWKTLFGNHIQKGDNTIERIDQKKLKKIWQKRYEKVFSGQRMVFREEYMMGKETRIFEIMGIPIYEGDRISKASFFSTDISDRIQYEKQLRNQNRDLQKVNKELDSFVYSASHDLKAPLSSIQGLIFLVKSESDPDARQKYYEMMDKSIRRLDQFIRDIIDYSRNTRIEVDQEEINLSEMIESIFEDMHYLEQAKEFEHTLTIDDGPSFYGDATRVRIIMRNLISNALRYGYREDGPNQIDITIKISRKKARIIIRDHGKGIEKIHHDKIFNMFYRAHETSSGTGLGLYIVKETLDKLKGTVTLLSDDSGTTFEVHLPNRHRKNP